MASPAKTSLGQLHAAPTNRPWTASRWCSPFDPVALPETPNLSAGQRRVLLACVQLFADQGFHGTSIRDIAAVAGLQSPTLYSHFPSKEAMLSELLVFGHEQYLDRTLAAVLEAGSDPKEQLVALVREYVLLHCEYPRMGVIATREIRSAPAEIWSRLESVTTRSATVTRDILRRGVEQGVFTLVESHVTMLALASMGVDAARWFPFQSEISADELARDYASLALRMVGAVS